MTLRNRITWIALLPPAILLAPRAHAQSTSWIGNIGDWSVASNWSNGEPTAALDAVIPGAALVNVTMAGETCRNLVVGTNFDNPTLSVNAGSLTVLETIQVPMAGSGGVHQQNGQVSADSLILGTTSSIGQYAIDRGTLAVNHLLVGTTHTASSANFTTTGTNPTVNVAHTLIINKGANNVHGTGTLNFGTTSADSIIVLGAWQMANRPTTNATNFVMRPMSTMNVTVLFEGITPVVATGTARLDGTLNVFDVLAPEGTWELIRGNPLAGAFDSVVLPPAGNWSWRVEGNSLFITKGTVAVEPTTWGRVKAFFLRPGILQGI
jgi:hypothetical protein